MKALIAIVLAMLLLSACDNGTSSATLASARGHWTVVNYWAEWCKPCIKEIPELNKLASEHAAIRVFGVNYDGETGELLQQQIDKLGIEFPLLIQDPAEDIGIRRPVVLPTTLILAPDGKLAATLVGPQTLESLLAATKNAVTDQ